MQCRTGCGACCIFLDISSSFKGHPNGKPMGVRCNNLDKNNHCTIHNTSDYPKVCKDFKAETLICGNSFDEAKKVMESLG
jgi:hypothetical protein